MIAIGVGVKKMGNRIPGVVINSTGPIEGFVKETWYQVQWVDGNISEEPESLLDILKPPSRQMVTA